MSIRSTVDHGWRFLTDYSSPKLVSAILRNHLAYRWDLATPVPVGYVSFAPTLRCTSRCIMCSIWGEDFQTLKSKELSYNQWLKVFSESAVLRQVPIELPRAGVTGIGVSGGEPFLYQDIVPLVEGLLDLPDVRLVTVASNGQLTDRVVSCVETILPRMAKQKRLRIRCSLDGPEDIHDQVRGVPQAFRRTWATVQTLLQLRRDHPQLEVLTAAVVQPKNVDYIEEFSRHLADQGVPFDWCVLQVGPFFRNENAGYGYHGYTSEQIQELLRLCDSNNVYGMRQWLTRPERRPLHCFAGFASVYISFDGSVHPCQTMATNPERVMGNVSDKPFDTIWNSAHAGVVRQRVRKCAHSGCWSGCELAHTFIQWDVVQKLTKIATLGNLDYYRICGLKQR